jgi:hypothetical protein
LATPNTARISAARRFITIVVPVVVLLIAGGDHLVQITEAGVAIQPGLTAFGLALGVGCLAAAGALLSGRRIGWLFAVSIVGWEIVAWLAQWQAGAPRFGGMMLLGISALLITSREVRALYRDEPD